MGQGHVSYPGSIKMNVNIIRIKILSVKALGK